MSMIKYVSSSSYNESGFGTTTTLTRTWTHPGSTGRNRGAVLLVGLSTAGGATSSVSATYGGVPMTLQGVGNSATSGGNDGGRLGMLTLINPPSGSQTISVTWQLGVSLFVAKQVTYIMSTYDNIRSFSGFVVAPANQRGSICTVSINNPVPSNYCIFGHLRIANTAFTSYNQTQRDTATANFARVLVGDATNVSGSVTSTATMETDYWQACGILAQRHAEGDGFAV